MAKTAAERAHDYRARKREQRGAGPVMPVADHEAFKAKVRVLAEQDRAQIAALLLDNERLTAERDEAQAGRSAPGIAERCKVCGGAFACLSCSLGDGYA